MRGTPETCTRWNCKRGYGERPCGGSEPVDSSTEVRACADDGAEVAGRWSSCMAHPVQWARRGCLNLHSDVHTEARRKQLIPNLDSEGRPNLNLGTAF